MLLRVLSWLMGSESSILAREPLKDIDDFRLTNIFLVSSLLERLTTLIWCGDDFCIA